MLLAVWLPAIFLLSAEQHFITASNGIAAMAFLKSHHRK
jgi:hypothetical protein